MARRQWMMAVTMVTFLLPGCGDMMFADLGRGMPSVSPPSAPQEGDKYEGVGTQPFVVTATDPLSTFAADVDTASYDIFRRDVQEDRLPAPSSVRLEEYVNAFSYDYPRPQWDDDHPFRIHLQGAKSPFSGTRILSVGIQGVEIPEDQKKPANLVFLVDVSGSMSSPNKLPLVKILIKEALQNLDAADTVSIVTYAGFESVALPPTLAWEVDTITAVVDGLGAGGSTAGQAGLELAYEQAQASFIEGGVNHVILCTDGDFNVGMSSDAEMVAFIETQRETGVTLTAVGFGYGNLNDAMMEKVSNAGNGIYAIVSSEDHAISYAHKRLLNTAYLIAKDVKIQVQFNPEHVYAYRLLGYENRALDDHQFMDDRVDAGEVGSGHSVTALYEVILVDEQVPMPEGAPEPVAGNDDPTTGLPTLDALVQVRIRYKHIAADDAAPAIEMQADLGVEGLQTALADAAPSMQWATAIAAFAEILKGSPYADIENLPTIESLIASNTDNDADRQEFRSLLGTAKDLLLAVE